MARSGGTAGLRRIRVLRVIARMNLGGPAHQASLLSGRLDPERFETLLVHGTVAPGEESMADMAERESARVKLLPSLGQPIRPRRDLRSLASLAGIVRRFRPHIVHTHTAKAGFLGRLAPLLALRPPPVLVHTYHGHVLEGYFGRARARSYLELERRLASRSDCLVGVSRATVDDLVRLGVAPRERFRVIPLGLDLEPFARTANGHGETLRRELGMGDDEVLLAYVGRVVPIKRLDVLLRAVARARGEGAPVRLAVVGDGEMRPALERLAAGLGIGSAAQFLGYRRDLPAVFGAADVAVLSSDNEGTPVSLIEAAAAGVPAAATAVGGVPEVVTPQTGMLVPPGDDRALAEAIARLAAHGEWRRSIGRCARERALARYSAERLVADVECLYRELMSARRKQENLCGRSG